MKNSNFFSYHTGNVAFGSSLLSFFCKVAILFKEDDEREQLLNSNKSFVLKVVTKIFLLFSPTLFICNTFTMTALRGKSFWGSMKRVYSVILENPGKYLALNSVSY